MSKCLINRNSIRISNTMYKSKCSYNNCKIMAITNNLDSNNKRNNIKMYLNSNKITLDHRVITKH